MHVRHDPDRGILPETGNAGGLAGVFHDGLDLTESPADHLQRGAGQDGFNGTHHQLLSTGGYFLFGILLSALFQRYVPQDLMVNVFGGNEAWGVLMAATIGVPLYACGGGTIPLLQQWLWEGMSMGSAAAFMITGPATKITNLGALKIAMGWKRFALYILFVMTYSFVCGIVVNLIV